MIRLFEMVNERVAITPNCLLIPEFKAVVDKYKDPIAALTYINFLVSPDSPYSDTAEADKSENIARDIKGDYSLDDFEMVDAVKKAKELFTTPTRRFYLDAKIGLEKLGEYLRNSEISAGRDGNDATFRSILSSVGTINAQFKVLDREYQEEISALRGKQQSSYDEKG